MKSSNECNKEKRAAMKAKGMVELRVWVYPECKAAVKRKAEIQNDKFEKNQDWSKRAEKLKENS